jgi:hypothetical protein
MQPVCHLADQALAGRAGVLVHPRDSGSGARESRRGVIASTSRNSLRLPTRAVDEEEKEEE